MCKFIIWFRFIVLVTLPIYGFSMIGARSFNAIDYSIIIQDTVLVKLDETYGKFIEHKVTKKQTLYSLANAYGIDLYDVYDYNASLKERILGVNDVLRMPLSDDHIVTDAEKLDPNKEYKKVFYRIQKNDNLYRVSKLYFHMSFESLMTRNKLRSHDIKIGQSLFIGWYLPENNKLGKPDYQPDRIKTEQKNLEKTWTITDPSPFSVQYKALDFYSSDMAQKYSKSENNANKIIPIRSELKPVILIERKPAGLSSNEKAMENKNSSPDKAAPRDLSMSVSMEKRVLKSKVLKRKMMEQTGVAQWAKNLKQSSDLYVLHPSAPINSVVEISNPMTHRKIYAKVLSNMPPGLYTSDICVVVSPGVANLLGAIDSRFYVKVRYVEETIQ